MQKHLFQTREQLPNLHIVTADQMLGGEGRDGKCAFLPTECELMLTSGVWEAVLGKADHA